jgi:hypothetical protein
MPLIGANIRHTLDFVMEIDGGGIAQGKEQVLRLSYTPRTCAFVFLWNILLDAGGHLPKRLGNLLEELKNLGFKLYAIRPSDARDVGSAFPSGVTPFNGIFAQEETQEFTSIFRRCYTQMGEKSVLYFGGDDFLYSVIHQRQEKDVFVAVDPNPDIIDGTPSYLEELLAMVLVVQAGKKITSFLQI